MSDDLDKKAEELLGSSPKKPEYKSLQVGVDDIPFATNGIGQPHYYADYIRGAMASHGVAHLNFVRNAFDVQEGALKSVHVATVAFPLEQTRAWAKYLSDMADHHDLPPLPEGPENSGDGN